MTKETMRLYYSLMRSFPEKRNQQTQAMVMMKRQLRKALKEKHDPLRFSLRQHYFSELAICLPGTEPWRGHYTDWDSWKLYAIFHDDGFTDAEIDSIIQDQIITIHSAFDCTGKTFTQYIHWKRTPVGIAVVHALGLDV